MQLTKREIEVLGLAATGLRNAEIAQALGISKRTVEVHIRHCMLKLSSKSRQGAIYQACRQDFLEVA